jgi:hypothetical protein
VAGEPFAFDTDSDSRPVESSIMFVAADGICYAYGFSVLGGEVVSEWAERYATVRPTLLFDRQGMSIKFGAGLKGANRAVEKTVKRSALYLSAASAGGHDGLAPLYNWFSEQLRTFPAGGHEPHLGHVLKTLANDPPRARRLASVLSKADLGLMGLRTERRRLSDAEAAGPRGDLGARAPIGAGTAAGPRDEAYTAYGQHHFGNTTWELPLESESAGTRAMLGHAFVIDEALRDGATAVFDELNASLHPLLARELIRTFKDRRLNPLQAQLVFTTHDVSLLDASLGDGAPLGRDEVWLAEKDSEGRSTLKALADYGPRERDNLARRYLSGRYGGVPENVGMFAPAGI